MIQSYYFDGKEALMSLLLVAALYVAHTSGVVVGRRWGLGSDRSQTSTIQAALLGLLALLLGFSFTMAETRFEARRVLVVHDANAIGTAYLRIDALPEEAQPELRRLFRTYIDLRLRFAEPELDDAAVAGLVNQTHQTFEEIWLRVAALARKDPHSVVLSITLDALNQMNDLGATRFAAARAHVPPSILALLVIVALMAMFWVGVGYCRATGDRPRAVALGLATLIGVLMVVIFDLDQPRHGLIQVSTTPLAEERARMND